MTTEEKLKHFQDICMEDARERSARMLDDYMKALEGAYEEHTADARRRADMQVEAETEKLEREINKRLSIGQLDLTPSFAWFLYSARICFTVKSAGRYSCAISTYCPLFT